MRQLLSRTLFTTLVVLSVFYSVEAYAMQSVVGGSPSPAGMDPKTMAWWAVTALICNLVMNLTAPGTPTPWNWSPQARFYLALGASAVSGVAHGIESGVTIQTAVLTAGSALVTALLSHFASPNALQKIPDAAKDAAKTVALLCLVFFGSRFIEGCTPAQAANDTNIVNGVFTLADQACVDAVIIAPLLDPSLPPATAADISAACKLGPAAQSFIDQAIALFTQQPALAAKYGAYKRAHQAAGQW